MPRNRSTESPKATMANVPAPTARNTMPMSALADVRATSAKSARFERLMIRMPTTMIRRAAQQQGPDRVDVQHGILLSSDALPMPRNVPRARQVGTAGGLFHAEKPRSERALPITRRGPNFSNRPDSLDLGRFSVRQQRVPRISFKARCTGLWSYTQ